MHDTKNNCLRCSFMLFNATHSKTARKIFDCIKLHNFVLMHITCLLLLLLFQSNNPKTDSTRVQQSEYRNVGFVLSSWGIVITNWCYKYHYNCNLFANDSSVCFTCWFIIDICIYYFSFINRRGKLIYDVKFWFLKDSNLERFCWSNWDD